MIDKNVWLTEQTDFVELLAKWQRIVDLMARIYKAPAGFIVQRTEEGFQVAIASKQKENPYPASGGVIPADTNIFCKHVVEQLSMLYVKEATKLAEWVSNPEVTNDKFNSYMGLPLLWPNGEAFGTICVMDFDITDYDADQIQLMHHFRDLVQSDLEVLHQYELMQELAIHDELTQLYNRRGFLALAENRLMLAKRNNEALALIFIDIDNMKKINDEYGHKAGDEALINTAKSLKVATRQSDICARIGGDEFLVLANDNHEALENACEGMSARLQQEITKDNNFNVGISYGIVEITDFTRPIEYWIEQADTAMYKHKQDGK
jgi:diguanylate cyclase (GGDEF)-like protein